MPTGGDSLRTVRLPFVLDRLFKNPIVHADGREVILVGRRPAETASKIFSMPLDGSVPRVLATLPEPLTGATLALSPDDSTLAYSVEGAPSSTIYELDASPLLKTRPNLTDTARKVSSVPNLAARVDALFTAYDKPGSPGCALGVVRNGKMIYAKGYGLANVEHHVPLTSTSVLEIASLYKQFTAASILLLAEQGKLSLDDDIRRYLPELPSYFRSVAIRDLLHHRSGTRDMFSLMSLAGKDAAVASTEDGGAAFKRYAVTLITRQHATNFPPGDQFQYSNSGYFLLGLIVERVSGMDLSAFEETHIGRPLGMTHTNFHNTTRRLGPLLATGYSAAGAATPIGKGGMYSTVEDLLLWDQNFYSMKVGGRALQDELHRAGVLTNGYRLSYASGLYVSAYRGLPTVWHDGDSDVFLSMLLRFPQQRFSVVCLCNVESATPNQLAYRVAEVFLGDLMAPPPERPAAAATVPLPEAVLKQHAGWYRNLQTQELRRIVALDGALVLTLRGNDWKLNALDANTFVGVATPGPYALSFQPGAVGQEWRMVERLGDLSPSIWERMEPVSPMAAELAAYTGKYYSDELDVIYEVAVEGDQLAVTVRPPRAPRWKVRATYRDAFANVGGTQLVFDRDSAGGVAAFTLYRSDVRNMRFVRQAQ